MPYLVDGYNLSRAARLSERSSNDESHEVVRLLNRFARLKKTKVTVVFDGYPSDWNRTRSLSRSFDCVKIIFAGSESNADMKIRGMIAGAHNRRAWVVVSSDHAVHGYARASGMRSLRADEFLEAAHVLLLSKVKEEVKIDKKEMDYWLDVFGEKSNDPAN
jgi:predicted RNA-binding protein with PIN domain